MVTHCSFWAENIKLFWHDLFMFCSGSYSPLFLCLLICDETVKSTFLRKQRTTLIWWFFFTLVDYLLNLRMYVWVSEWFVIPLSLRRMGMCLTPLLSVLHEWHKISFFAVPSYKSVSSGRTPNYLSYLPFRKHCFRLFVSFYHNHSQWIFLSLCFRYFYLFSSFLSCSSFVSCHHLF